MYYTMCKMVEERAGADPSEPEAPASAQKTASAQTPAPARARQATSQDLATLAAVLAGAFLEDPPFVWMMPDERRRPAQLRRFFEIELRHVGFARGMVWTTDDLAGAALSIPPGKWRLPWRTQVRLGRRYWQAFGVHLPRATMLLARMEARHPRQPHHYLPFIGVAPQRQGRGTGTALMKPTLELCTRAGLPAYLEATCERNARLYSRLGFDVIDELNYGASEPLRLMLRPPPSAS
jgi:GNAT superfamily N-acetyltransferase